MPWVYIFLNRFAIRNNWRCLCHCAIAYLVNEFILYIFQAGILAVGRGNQVVEPVIGSDGKMWVVFVVFWSY